MTAPDRRLLSLVFFLSGFAGLVYQVVWVRLGFASFGVITPVLSVILSVFMAGLFVGSWAAGRWVEPLSRRFNWNGAHFYALAELTLCVGAFAAPALLGWTEATLLPSGDSGSTSHLFWSSVAIAISIFPWCIAMGATFPCMLAFLRQSSDQNETGFSFLYTANVVGALAGTFLTAVVLVEILGFRGTLAVAASANLLVAAIGIWLARKTKTKMAVATRAEEGALPSDTQALVTLFATGFTSMAMEVVWTRAFAPTLRTEVYSFAGLLLMYLFATWMGSWAYRRALQQNRVWPTQRLMFFLGLAAFFPLLPTDPRLRLGVAGVLVGIFPFCYALGYLTPRLIDRFSSGRPHAAGFAYGINVLGCILGPLAASYLFLPGLGSQGSLVWLAVPYVALWLMWEKPSWKLVPLGAAALLAIFFSRTYEDQWRATSKEALVLRDHTASVIAYGQGMDRMLLVNGMGITNLTTITKVMAHVPLAHLKDPKQALVICFGMGTTFRSLLMWNLDVTAVELVPSVSQAFGFFHADGPALLARPEAHLVIDDGRRFLRRTEKIFDLITIDPPPPTAAAGSSLLYSREFYTLAKSHLAPNGILQQWLPSTEFKTLEAVTKSIYESFPYVRVFHSNLGVGGHHFFASHRPFPPLTAEEILARLSETARQDLVAWPDANTKDPLAVIQNLLQNEVDPLTLLSHQRRVTDDRPYNEYYLLRRTFGT